MNLTKLSDAEINVLVAEKVMGWTRLQSTSRPEIVAFLSPASRKSQYFQSQIAAGKLVDAESGDEANAPHYSTLINAAMQIVEKVREQGFGVTLKTKQSFWRVEIYPEPDNGHDGLNVENDSLSRAICEAALMAIESGVK